MTSLQHLLPGPDESVRCADHSRTLSVDPGGTAIGCDRVILIETPLPWPKPVFDHPDLATVAPILKASTVPTRTLAYVGDRLSPAGQAVYNVITFDRNGGTEASGGPTVLERRFSLESREALETLAQALAADDDASIAAMATYQAALQQPVVLICTQGSHDVCCGSEGARFAAEAETVDQARVYRVSHTGGHRFAPTAMTLPDGRMWADLDLDVLRTILWRTGTASDVVGRCRGWWGAAPGPAQMAERAVFEKLSWDLEDRQRTVTQGEIVDGVSRCLVTSDDRSWEVTVVAGRAVPTIACRQPGGLPSKQSTEYEVRGLVEVPVA